MESMSIRGEKWAGPWSLSILCLSQANEAGCRAGIGKRWSCNRIHVGPAPSSCLLAFDCLKAADMVAALFSTSHRTHKAETCCSSEKDSRVVCQFQTAPDGLRTRLLGHQNYSWVSAHIFPCSIHRERASAPSVCYSTHLSSGLSQVT